MTVRNRTYLKTKFQAGDAPTQTDFFDLIDSMVNIIDEPQSIIPPVTGNAGKILKTNGFTTHWSNEDALWKDHTLMPTSNIAEGANTTRPYIFGTNGETRLLLDSTNITIPFKIIIPNTLIDGNYCLQNIDDNVGVLVAVMGFVTSFDISPFTTGWTGFSGFAASPHAGKVSEFIINSVDNGKAMIKRSTWRGIRNIEISGGDQYEGYSEGNVLTLAQYNAVSAGVTGSYETWDGKTVTVTNGIITGII